MTTSNVRENDFKQPDELGDFTATARLIPISGLAIVIGLIACVLADTAYDSAALRELIASMGAEAVIPAHPTRKTRIPHDRGRYKLRNRIERCFNKLKHFRRFATRYDRRACNFLSLIHLASAMIWMR